MSSSSWHVFKGPKKLDDLPELPPWRSFSSENRNNRGSILIGLEKEQLDIINAAIYLRRPLLVEGQTGVGKTTLAYSIAKELMLGEVLRWSITTHTSLNDGLYRYDAIARLQDTHLCGGSSESLPISDYLRLGVLGTAFVSPSKPRVLLIDEIDKSNFDLPNDLLHLFEEGEFEIPELARLKDNQVEIYGSDNRDVKYPIEKGIIQCKYFPIIIMTSNEEKDFSPAFLRRCLRLKLPVTNEAKIKEIIKAYFKQLPKAKQDEIDEIIKRYIAIQEGNNIVSPDQLLNIIHLVLQTNSLDKSSVNYLLQPLNSDSQVYE